MEPEGKALTTWEERMAKAAKDVAKLERPSLSTISLRSGIMQINQVPVPGNKLLCVIVASAFENQYYDKPFNPDVKENPVCFALSAEGKDMVPYEGSLKKQNEVCVTCPQLKWGSDPKPNSKGKACKQKRRLAILPHAALEDGNVKTAEMAVITLPVTSGKNWANYANRTSSEVARPPWGVLTEISVHPHQKNQFEVKFDLKAVVNEKYLEDVYSRIEPALVVLLTPYDTSQQAPEKVPEGDGKKRKF